MRRHRVSRGSLLLALLVIAAAGIARAENDGPAGKHVRLLAIGNSFSGNATRYLKDLVAASGRGNRLTFGHASIGGCPLEKHVALAEAHEKDPNDPQGRPYAGKSSLREMLAREAWDYVTIQQASIKSFDLANYRPWAARLHDYVKRHAPQAEVLIHQTWAYRADDVLFRDGKFSADEMHRRVRDAYRTIAGELTCRVIPVGDAFHAAQQEPGWRFDPKWAEADPQAHPYPKLPEQRRSLHAGWRWSKRQGKDVLAKDTHHAGRAGEYLAACVWFEVLFGQSVVENPFVPKGMDPDDAAFLRLVVHRVASEGTD